MDFNDLMPCCLIIDGLKPYVSGSGIPDAHGYVSTGM